MTKIISSKNMMIVSFDPIFSMIADNEWEYAEEWDKKSYKLCLHECQQRIFTGIPKNTYLILRILI